MKLKRPIVTIALMVALGFLSCSTGGDGGLNTAEVQGLSVKKTATKIKLSWIDPSAPGFSSVVVIDAAGSESTVGKGVQSFESTGLAQGSTYTYTIKTKNSDGELSSGVTYTVRFHLYEFVRSFPITAAQVASFGAPTGLSVDSDGNVYISNHSGDDENIVKYDSSGTFVRKWDFDPGNGDCEGSTVAVGSDGTEYVYGAQCSSGKIFKYTTSGTLVSNAFATLAGPVFGMSSDTDGSIYVSYEDGDIVRLSPSGAVSCTCLTAAASNPEGFEECAVDSDGNIFGSGQAKLAKYDKFGTKLIEVDGLPSTGFTYRGRGIAVGPDDCVVGTDPVHSKVVVYDNDLNLIKSWGTAGTAAGTQFDTPSLAAFDDDGLLYVVDQGNRRVQIFKP